MGRMEYDCTKMKGKADRSFARPTVKCGLGTHGLADSRTRSVDALRALSRPRDHFGNTPAPALEDGKTQLAQH